MGKRLEKPPPSPSLVAQNRELPERDVIPSHYPEGAKKCRADMKDMATFKVVEVKLGRLTMEERVLDRLLVTAVLMATPESHVEARVHDVRDKDGVIVAEPLSGLQRGTRVLLTRDQFRLKPKDSGRKAAINI